MTTKSVFHTVYQWLKTSELFLNPVKLLPGKWILFEYYTEPEGELIHLEEVQLGTKELFWEIEFFEDQRFSYIANLTLPLLSGKYSGRWGRSRNFLQLIYSDDQTPAEFQFAIDKGNLRLLKKTKLGKIEVFGFFRRKS